jgi:hypothetical protein
LQSALLIGPFFAVLSFASYLFASIYVLSDKQKVEQFIKSKVQRQTDLKVNFETNLFLDPHGILLDIDIQKHDGHVEEISNG